MDPDLDDGPEGQGSAWGRLGASGFGPPPSAAAARRPRFERPLPLMVVALVSGSVCAGLAVGVMALTGRLAPAERIVERVAEVSADDDSVESEGVARLAESVLPSVVAVQTMSPAGQRVGSGLVIRSDGHVLANAHLVDSASSIHVAAADGRSFAARSAGSDTETDLAILTVDDAGLAPAVLGSSGALRVGETAVVIGARQRPQGSPSVTTGVIAGLGQVMEVGERRLYDVISTDAAIPLRASGGPLLNRHGAVVGITTRTASADDGDHGPGVVIPIDQARRVAEQLIADGKVAHPWLGLSGTDLGPGAAAEFGVERGALVRTVEPQSPALRSDLRVHDVVTAVDASPIATADEFTMLVRRHAPGDRVALTVVRSRATRIVTVRLDRAPHDPPVP